MTDFLMPSLGADMEEATMVEWNVKPGDQFDKGDIIAAVETDKGIIDIEIFDQGVVEEILVPVGETVAVDTPLASYISDGEQKQTDPGQRQRISPAAKRRAEELSISLEELVATGPQNSVALQDVERAASELSRNANELKEVPDTGSSPTAQMQKAIGKAMSRSKREIPHYYLAHTIDCSVAFEWMQQQNTQRSISERYVFSVLLLKALANALQKHPEFNGVMSDGSFKPSDTINVGVAISLRAGGLIAPAVLKANEISLADLMNNYRDLVNRARSGRLTNSEMTDATITLSSLGERGVDTVYPVIYPPQVAIAGFGAVAVRPWSVDGTIQPRHIVQATLAGDHRVSDGHRGASLLRSIDALLQQPEAL